MSIAAVERDTGLSKDTLRIWERRYGFPRPLRDNLGERAYPMEQVQKLRLLRRLLDAGHRPGKVVGLPPADLRDVVALLERGRRDTAPAAERSAAIDLCLRLVAQHDMQGLRQTLSQLATRLGVEAFVTTLVAPMTRAVGDAWLAGGLEVFQEHMYTESVQAVLRQQLAHIHQPSPHNRPHVLLSTFPGEAHGLGLLMAEVLLVLDGCYCVSLGTQTPLSDLVLAAQAHDADIVALSFTGVLTPNHLAAGLSELRSKLPAHVALWAGGRAPALNRRRPEDVMHIASLPLIAPALKRWREEHPG